MYIPELKNIVLLTKANHHLCLPRMIRSLITDHHNKDNECKSLKYCENYQSVTQRPKADKCWENGIDTFTTRIVSMMLREVNQAKITTLRPATREI